MPTSEACKGGSSGVLLCSLNIPCSPAYKPLLQLHPPTAVTHCAAAWLTRPQPPQRDGSASSWGSLPDLVVVRSTQLVVYAVRSSGPKGLTGGAVAVGAGDGGGPDAAAATAPPSLEVVCSSQLFGVVESVAVLRSRAPGQCDALLLTFRCGGGGC